MNREQLIKASHLAADISKVHDEVKKINTTSEKITQRFDNIHQARIEEGPAEMPSEA